MAAIQCGSILGADYPRKWVIFACRSTNTCLKLPEVGHAITAKNKYSESDNDNRSADCDTSGQSFLALNEFAEGFRVAQLAKMIERTRVEKLFKR